MTAENNIIFSSTKYLAVENVDEKLKIADNLINNCRFFICILNVGDVGVDHVKKNHSTNSGLVSVSYTHLTLPTILLV